MASSFPAIDKSVYDVFLSFRGADTRNNFTSHLQEAFDRAKIETFIDKKLERGEEITPALLNSIEAAKISVIIFSSDYASSTFCLDEAAKIMECRESKAQIVLPIFYKVDPSDIRKLNGSYGEAFARQEEKFKSLKSSDELSDEQMEKMQKWKSALCKAAKLSGWHIDHNSNEAEIIGTIVGSILNLLDLGLTCQSKGGELISTPIVGMNSAIFFLEKIWKCLMNEETSRIGVFGMGGVGKTTIITHVYNRLIRETNSYAHIYWVTVSKSLSIYKLQGDIAKVINLNLEKEEDERKRAALLWEALNRKKKFILILDDMWESFEVEEVGIPISVDVGKLLLTTRSHGVCKTMKCGGIMKMEPLSKQEGLDLFIKESGHQIDDNPEWRNLVDSVATQCVGLPLAIVSVARSTRKFVNIYEWRNILQELKNPSEGENHDMEEKVFKHLKVSYDRLRNEKYRQCLLYCSLFPEDYMIPRNALIVYWIGEGIIGKQNSRQAEFDKGNSIVNELIDASLLECHREDHVKMHDVVRDMTLTITRETSMVNAGSQLKNFPTEWPATLERTSLMENKRLEGCCSNLAPNCPKLKTLLIQANTHLTQLPNAFFVNMLNLTILDMGGLRRLEILPDSIAMLENLRVLILERCSNLKYIPSLARLSNLLHLDISMTSLPEIPNGLENLVNLKVLDMSCNIVEGLITSAVAEKLSHLQSLRLEESYFEVEPSALISLKNLETLKVNFYNFLELKSYLVSEHWRSLEEWHISKQPRRWRNYPIDSRSLPYKKVMFFLEHQKESENILIPDDIQFLLFSGCDASIDGILENGTFANLQELILSDYKDAPYLIQAAFADRLLHNVKKLMLTNCKDMKEIIATEEESLDESKHEYPTIVLPKLETLTIHRLGELRSIYKGPMACPSLQTIEITCCNKLERLPFGMLEEEDPRMILPSLKQIKGESSWWKSLQFDHPDAKTVFQPFFVKTEIRFELRWPKNLRSRFLVGAILSKHQLMHMPPPVLAETL